MNHKWDNTKAQIGNKYRRFRYHRFFDRFEFVNDYNDSRFRMADRRTALGFAIYFLSHRRLARYGDDWYTPVGDCATVMCHVHHFIHFKVEGATRRWTR